MPYIAKADLTSPFGTFRAGTAVDETAVPAPVLAAWAAAGAVEAAVVDAPEDATAAPAETAVPAPVEARARTRKTR